MPPFSLASAIEPEQYAADIEAMENLAKVLERIRAGKRLAPAIVRRDSSSLTLHLKAPKANVVTV